MLELNGFHRTRRFFAELDRSGSKNCTVYVQLDGFRRTRYHYVGSLADSFSSLYYHSVNLLKSVKNTLSHSTYIIDECVLWLRAPSVGCLQ